MKKENRLKIWEISWMAGVILSLILYSYLGNAQENLADGMIRLHVVAHSNEENDQKLKYDVRDEILLYAENLYETGMTPEEAESMFQAHLRQLEEAGQAVTDYEIRAEVTEIWFPTKEYDDFSLPSGYYTALNVTIGEGEGENWWCVAYPPLCLGAATETVDVAVEAGNFTQAEKDLITGEGYVLKFKSMEILGQIKGFFQ